MTTEKQAEEEIERIAAGLCKTFNVDPGAIIGSNAEPRFANYAGDSYMTWARDQAAIVMSVVGLATMKR